jgi:biotin carboxyl carrier protein
MRYFVTVEGRTFDVELTGEHAVIDGTRVAVELRTVPATGTRLLLADGGSHVVLGGAGAEKGEWDLQIDGRRLHASVVDERTRAIRALTGKSAAPAGPKPVRAPMPGMIIRVEVAAGQEVRPGQGVAIVEAMKMENELRADAGGVVRRVFVAAGEAVEKGQVLVEFEPPPPAGADA